MKIADDATFVQVPFASHATPRASDIQRWLLVGPTYARAASWALANHVPRERFMYLDPIGGRGISRVLSLHGKGTAIVWPRRGVFSGMAEEVRGRLELLVAQGAFEMIADEPEAESGRPFTKADLDAAWDSLARHEPVVWPLFLNARDWAIVQHDVPSAVETTDEDGAVRRSVWGKPVIVYPNELTVGLRDAPWTTTGSDDDEE